MWWRGLKRHLKVNKGSHTLWELVQSLGIMIDDRRAIHPRDILCAPISQPSLVVGE